MAKCDLRTHGSRAARCVLAMLLGISFASTSCKARGDLNDPEAIAHILGDFRSVEPRLSGGFHYRPCAPLGPIAPTPGHLVPEPHCPRPLLSQHERLRLSREIVKISNGPSGLLRARAALIGQIVLHSSAPHLSAAIEMVKKKMVTDGKTAEGLSDLAAAHLISAQRQDNPAAIFAALDAADQAVAVNGRCLEALFNRALALEYLSLETPARNAWLAYLQIDSSSYWADEARQRLARLDRDAKAMATRIDTTELLAKAALAGDMESAVKLAKLAPERARQLVQREILPRWGEPAKASIDSPTSSHYLAIARIIITELRPIGEDDVLTRSLATIDAAADNRKRLASLRRGHAAFGQGLVFYDARRDFDRASSCLRLALSSLQEGNSPFAGWAAMYLAASEYSRSLPGSASARLESLVKRPEFTRYPALAGRILWQLGLGELTRGERERAISHFEQASSTFHRLDDRESLVAVEDLLASAYELLGDLPVSVRHRYLALHGLRWVTTPRRRWVIIKTTAETLLERGELLTALDMLDELIQVASANPEARSQALLRRSTLLAQLGKHELATQDLTEAKATITHIEDPSLRARIGVDLLVSQISSLLRSNPSAALHQLEEPLTFYRKSRNAILTSRVLLIRSRVALVNGLERESENDLAEALRLAEQQWQEMKDQQMKISFLGELHAVLDDLLWAQSKRDPGAAFTTTERDRSRLLLEREGGQPLTVSEVQDALSSTTVLIEYALIRNKLLVWVVTRNRLSLKTTNWVPTKWHEIMLGVGETARGYDEEKLRSWLMQQYRLLIEPIANDIPAGATLVFVPEGDVSAVSFSALLNPHTSHFLVEDHQLLVAPSASLFVAGTSKTLRLRGTKDHSLVVIGDPEFDRGWHPDLEALPRARREVEAIARLFQPNVLVLVGSRATPNALKGSLVGRDIIHFAAHTANNSTGDTALVLAPSNFEPSSGDLTTSAISALSLLGTRLVVLSSCKGAVGPTMKGEGSLSLVRSFLYAGSPAVIAGVWPVDDRFSEDFFAFFYERLKADAEPVSALRATQLHFLQSRQPVMRSPWAWGALQIYGAQ
jgi:CHAT domain-containing protein